MRPSEALSRHRARVLEITLSHHVRNVRVFGSVSRGEDGPGSDIDLLVDPTVQTTYMGIGAIRYELKNLLGMDVDVVTPDGLPSRCRDRVLRDAMPI
ncbi:nucleotidyltransferase family protein [Variovorax sp. W2I14]|uniref:nucleotidyltransferase family protein n=1 Tax=Variovorax sp. W2I14 TaxID=3042290 RepID=UPI003D1DAEF1